MNTILTRRALFAVAALVAAFTFAFNAPQAEAGCCTIGIDNNSSCTFRVCAITPAGERCFTVGLGANSFDIPGCPDVRLATRDDCGNVVYFPIAIGTCVTVRVNGCCLLICRDSDCRYSVYDTHCGPC